MRPDDSAVLDATPDATPDATLEAIRRDLADSCDEEPGLGLEEERLDRLAADHGGAPPGRLDRKVHVRERLRLQHELVPRQDWVQDRKLRVVVLLEGRDSGGKGGVIERITQRLNPRVCRVAALPAPSEHERTRWYFQRYVSHLPLPPRWSGRARPDRGAESGRGVVILSRWRGYSAAMAKRPMTLDLFTTLDIVDDDVSAVVDAYLADPTPGSVAFGDGFRIDPAAAVASHPFARTLIDQPWADAGLRRAAIRAAILLAEPERA
ncbi:hypothetical protein [Methylobacterium radiotolerans]|uniref:hypothetical protein n=1 Tax=Methylobacterium radiotolerans TaxID=31998 RepID=UPI0009D64F20